MMDYLLKHGWFPPCLIFLLLFSSCAQLKIALSSRAPVLEPASTTVQTPVEINQHMTAGNYQKAIELYKSKIDNNPQDEGLILEYVKSLKSIKTAADRALDREDFSRACKTYNLLLKTSREYNHLAHLLPFDQTQLHLSLTDCKTSLYRKGFQEYRMGNLGNAISLWQDYLSIDPDNADIKKALNTARTQQRNLQQRN